jgi:hypothetical protein
MTTCGRFRLVEVEADGVTCADGDGRMDTKKSHTGEAMLTAIDLAHQRTGSRRVGVVACILPVTEASIR